MNHRSKTGVAYILHVVCVVATMLLIGRHAGAQSAPIGSEAWSDSAEAPNANAFSNVTVDQVTGTFSARFPFKLPAGRGHVHPELSIVYNSSSGYGQAGYSWNLDLASIERRPQTGRVGPPAYDDTDRFAYRGDLLVPVCKIADCNPSALGEVLPPLPSDWTYLRLAVEGQFLRFFVSADRMTWIAQAKSGEVDVYGVPYQSSDTSAVEFQSGDPAKPYRWNLVAQSDEVGASPSLPFLGVNTTIYLWGEIPAPNSDGRAYLTDILNTPSVDGKTYAHHVHLDYSVPAGTLQPWVFAPAWLARPICQLNYVSVWSSSWGGSEYNRWFVRGYALSYSSDNADDGQAFDTVPLLTSVTTFAPASTSVPLVPEPADIGANIAAMLASSAKLPATTYTYSPPSDPAHIVGQSWPTIQAGTGVTPIFADVNGDGLSDVVLSNKTSGQTTQHVLMNTGSGGFTPSDLTLPGGLWNQPMVMGSFPTTSQVGASPVDVLVSPTLTQPCSELQPSWIPGGARAWTASAGTCPNGIGPSGPKVNVPALGTQNFDYQAVQGTAVFGDLDGDGVTDMARGPAIVLAAQTGGFIAEQNVGQSLGNTADYNVLGPLETFLSSQTANGATTVFAKKSGPLSPLPKLDCSSYISTGVGPSGIPTQSFGASLPLVCTDQQPAQLVFQAANDYPVETPYETLADMNGDGVDDMVVVLAIGQWFDTLMNATPNPVHRYTARVDYTRVIVIPGDGLGGFVFGSAYENKIEQPYYYPREGEWVDAPSMAAFQIPIVVADVTGDGLADIALGYPNGPLQGKVVVYPGTPYDSRTTQLGAPILRTGTSWDIAKCVLRTATFDSAGARPGLVSVCRQGSNPSSGNYALTYWPSGAGVTTRRLTAVTNGRGAAEAITYRSSSDLGSLSQQGGSTFWSIPQARALVTQVVSTNALGGAKTETRGTNYTYSNPVYDNVRRTFQGFTDVSVTNGVGPTAGLTTVHTRYLVYPSYSGPNGVGCTTTGATVMDCPADAFNGRPTLVETTANGGPPLSTVHTTYGERVPVSSAGLSVRYVFPEQTDTYLFDTGQPSWVPSSPSTVSLSELDGSLGEAQISTSASVRLPAAYAHLVTSRAVDSLGNENTATDFGKVDGTAVGGPSDPAVVARQHWSTFGALGWTWRKDSLDVVPLGGGGGTQGERHLTWNYDASTALLQSVQASLAGSLTASTLGRQNASGGGTAPFPTGASLDGPITLMSYVYDSYGNPLQVTDARGACVSIGYDGPYSELQTSTVAFTGGVCNVGTPLITSHSIHRGLGLPLLTIDANGQQTTMTYDGFGRLTSRTRNTPLLSFGSIDTDTIAYTDPVGGPLHYAHITRGVTPAFGPQPAQTRDEWVAYDGFDHAVMRMVQPDQPSEPDPRDPCPEDWITTIAPDRDAWGRPVANYPPVDVCGSPMSIPAWIASFTNPTWVSYDPFNRVTATVAQDGTTTSTTTYHALSIDTQDERQGLGGNGGTTVTRDGHGRTVGASRWGWSGQRVQDHVTQISYLATGEVSQVTETDGSGAGGPAIVRSRTYDTFGRVTTNTEPNSGTWSYAYDNASNVLATADPRGCGENVSYDPIGRITAEDYSPCAGSVPSSYSPTPDATYQYDTGITQWGGASKGRVVATSDRATTTQYQYDIRGRTARVWKQLAALSSANGTGAAPTQIAPHLYVKAFDYDDLDELAGESTGADIAEVSGTALGGTSANRIVMGYSPRGELMTVGGDYGTLISGGLYDADGFLLYRGFGDRAGTSLQREPDARRRLKRSGVLRSDPATWTAPSSSTYSSPGGAEPTVQTQLENSRFAYDANQLGTVYDQRNGDEWPSGAKPVTRSAQYDSFGRVTSIAYAYSGVSGRGADRFTSPLHAEETGAVTPAVPVLPFQSSSRLKRPLWQTFAYDSVGNTTQTDDDQHLFWDRSIGTITGNATPNQLGAAAGGAGSLTTVYDAAGNLTDLAVTRCAASSGCSYRFRYDWDEVGNLVRARRWDDATTVAASPLPARAPTVDLTYTYDANGHRVLTAPTAGNTVSAEIFSTLRLDQAAWNGTDYALSATSERVYLGAGGMMLGRVEFDPCFSTGTPVGCLPSADGNATHVYLEIGDHLGSTSSVIDRASGELVEKVTYQGFGQVESDYRPERWKSFREVYRFTGKEDDSEVGLTYFGARFYSAPLGRWMSPDPVAVHRLGADLNPYAYVRGHLMDTTDPLGLEDDGSDPTGSEPVEAPDPESLQREAEAVAAYVAQTSYAAGLADYQAMQALAQQAASTPPAAPPVADPPSEESVGDVIAERAQALLPSPKDVLRAVSAASSAASVATMAMALYASALGGGPGAALVGGGILALAAPEISALVVIAAVAGTVAVVADTVSSQMSSSGDGGGGGGGGPSGSTVDEVLKDATPGNASKPGMGSSQFEKPGGMPQANKDFDSLTTGQPVKAYPGGIRSSTLPDGSTVSVRPTSGQGSPTLQINPPAGNPIKVRYP